MHSSSIWKFTESWRPNLILIDLGGNDYNHQDGDVPSNSTFTEAMEDFLLNLFNEYYPPGTSKESESESESYPTIVNVCGMGDPLEAEYDPDNNRCRPCPHVQDATEYFQQKHLKFVDLVHYIYVPCDGSVVTGIDDIGCQGHKNRIGQARVAAYLEPKLRKIMNIISTLFNKYGS